MKVIKKFILCIGLLISFTTTVYAEDITGLVSKDPRFQMVDNKVNVICTSEDNPIRDVISTIINTTRTCSGYEFNGNIWHGDGDCFILNQNVLDVLIYRTNWTNEFVKNTVPALIPNGMTKDEAILFLQETMAYVLHLHADIEQ